jgi:hypothetical protein
MSSTGSLSQLYGALLLYNEQKRQDTKKQRDTITPFASTASISLL